MYPRLAESATISVVTQPSNTPDTKTNVLCFFPSMSARVNNKKKRNLEELVKRVEREYWSYDTETLERGWAMKSRVLAEIMKAKGNNNFKMPHRKKS